MINGRQARMDRKLERVIGYTLRIGVIAAAVLVLAGGVYYLADNASAPVDYRTFQPTGSNTHDLSGMLRNALALNSLGIIQLGLLVLIATPIMRVVFSIIAFAIEGDVVYGIVALVVLATLLYSLLAKGT